jgi:hypothetical protein
MGRRTATVDQVRAAVDEWQGRRVRVTRKPVRRAGIETGATVNSDMSIVDGVLSIELGFVLVGDVRLMDEEIAEIQRV